MADIHSNSGGNYLDVTSRLCQKMLQADSARSVLEKLIAELSEVLPLDPSGGLIYIDQSTSTVSTIAEVGPCSGCSGCDETIRIGECLCGIAVSTKSLVYSLSSSTDQRHKTIGNSEAHGHVVVPVSAGQNLTYLAVFYLPDGTVLDHLQLSLFRAAARVATLALLRIEASRHGGRQRPASRTPEPIFDSNRLILVAEDEPALRDLMIKTLRVLGCEATGVPDAKSLSASLDACTPDVVLLDWNLGDSNASGVLEELRRRDIPVVILTGDPDAITDVGVPVVGKPIDRKTLSKVLNAACRG